ncbi:fumarylacetoacetate hydrolase family protein [Roseibacterium sp. SDUM158017]|uniref:2-keto-4-pentenoate hydratase n=1 Tax=Roseicyclus salinarum TaxID=3036773 RepID=UPI002414F56F|nr:fumarylacetoacetate hydrolase family protein [Roseibacterium sp. SDUM158017]MDG4649197.1 fumarylacetoacetate hydrolase family protein [Roseibacterium sp. SDUM158017]
MSKLAGRPRLETTGMDDDAVVATLMRCLREGERIAPLTAGPGGLGMARAYRIAARVAALRERDGERPVGRKIGFTNRTIWDEYNVSATIVGPMYHTTVRPLDGRAVAIPGLAEPRIEPEIAFRLAAPPEPGMDAHELLGCVSGICAGFELVQSIFPGWVFGAADTVAAFGLHGAFLHGPIVELPATGRADWIARLAEFRTTLRRDGQVVDRGDARNVLGGGPVAALAHLARLVAETADAAPLAAGELVTTGTLTRALPVSPGETWRASFDGLPLDPIEVGLS